ARRPARAPQDAARATDHAGAPAGTARRRRPPRGARRRHRRSRRRRALDSVLVPVLVAVLLAPPEGRESELHDPGRLGGLDRGAGVAGFTRTVVAIAVLVLVVVVAVLVVVTVALLARDHRVTLD